MAAVRRDVAARPPAASLADHVRRTLALAGPVIVARCGILIMVSVDTIMTGHAGALELAWLAIAFSPHIAMLVTGIGLLTGTVILVSQADGAGRRWACGRVLWIGMANGVALGLVWAVVMSHGEDVLLLLGQSEELAAGGGEVLAMFAWGMPGIYLFTAVSMFLEGIGRTRPGMVVMIFANLVNFALNWVLIYGNLGFEPMGAAGAVLATSITRWLMFAALFAYLVWMDDRDAYGLLAPIEQPWRLQARFIRLGVPMALSYSFETTAFMTITMMAGLMGSAHVAAYQAVMNVVALCFMVAIGMATASAVRVGNAVGRRDMPGMRAAGWVGAGLIAVIMAVLALVLAAFREPIMAIYTDDPGVLAVAVPTLAIAALFLVGDGLQGVLVGVLRGAADVWATMWIGAFSFWVVMIPAAWLIGRHLGGGVPGLMWGEMTGILLATVLLAWRFRAVSRRDIRPV